VRRGTVAGVLSATLVCAVAGASVLPVAASAVTAAGRQSRTSNEAIAGADVYMWSTRRAEGSGDACTLAFAVESTPTKHVGALTAGHCLRTVPGGPLYTVHQTHAGKGNSTDHGHQLGVVHLGNAHLGVDGDNAFVTLLPHRRAVAQVFNGGPSSATTIPVAGLGHLTDGIHVCYSGAASGEHCGFTVVGKPRTVAFQAADGTIRIRHEWRATRRTCTSRVGDSGAPVYVERRGRAYAVGILSGGQEHSSQCPFYFTSVRLALKVLHLRLLTAPGS
jgi:hypothetical protein